jgi:hypothetical protein
MRAKHNLPPATSLTANKIMKSIRVRSAAQKRPPRQHLSRVLSHAPAAKAESTPATAKPAFKSQKAKIFSTMVGSTHVRLSEFGGVVLLVTDEYVTSYRSLTDAVEAASEEAAEAVRERQEVGRLD